jgi:hypothetical protein
MMLQPPPPHVLELFVEAAENKSLADELIENFNVPENNWKIFSDAENAAALLARHSSAELYRICPSV